MSHQSPLDRSMVRMLLFPFRSSSQRSGHHARQVARAAKNESLPVSSSAPPPASSVSRWEDERGWEGERDDAPPRAPLDVGGNQRESAEATAVEAPK